MLYVGFDCKSFACFTLFHSALLFLGVSQGTSRIKAAEVSHFGSECCHSGLALMFIALCLPPLIIRLSCQKAAEDLLYSLGTVQLQKPVLVWLVTWTQKDFDLDLTRVFVMRTLDMCLVCVCV